LRTNSNLKMEVPFIFEHRLYKSAGPE